MPVGLKDARVSVIQILDPQVPHLWNSRPRLERSQYLGTKDTALLVVTLNARTRSRPKMEVSSDENLESDFMDAFASTKDLATALKNLPATSLKPDRLSVP